MLRLGIVLVLALVACGGEPAAGRTQPTPHRYHGELVLDVYQPARDGTMPPVAMLVHGCCGDRRDMAGIARALTDRGARVVNASVSALGDGGGWPATYTDVACAYALTVAEFGGSADEIAIVAWGDGAMAATAVALGWRDIAPLATNCDVELPTAGPTTLIGLGGQYGWSGEPPDGLVTAATIGWFGAPPADDPTAWTWGNPTWWIEHGGDIDLDITLIGGTDDRTDDGATSEFVERLVAHSHTVGVTYIADASHGDLIQPRSGPGADAVETIARALGLNSRR